MRGDNEETRSMFTFVTPAQLVPQDHPLRTVRELTDTVLKRMSPQFGKLYSRTGRPSVPPEHLLRASLLQCFYGIRSERLLVEQIHYNLLFRWLSYLGHVVMENRNGLVVGCKATQADGFAERAAALDLLANAPRLPRSTVGADRGYDTRDFAASARDQGVTPHLAQNTSARRSAIDRRTTRHVGYEIRQRIRKTVEHPFGWLKQVAGLRQVKAGGLQKVDWVFRLGMAAYDLMRIGRLIRVAA